MTHGRPKHTKCREPSLGLSAAQQRRRGGAAAEERKQMAPTVAFIQRQRGINWRPQAKRMREPESSDSETKQGGQQNGDEGSERGLSERAGQSSRSLWSRPPPA